MKKRMTWVQALPEQIKVRVSVKMYKQIAALAKSQECSISDAVRILLSNALRPGSAAALRSEEGQ